MLLTDGASNAGRLAPLAAAALASDLGIKVYTIGVGSKGKVPFPDDTPWGRRIVMAELAMDEESLEQIASMTGGRYWNAQNTEALEAIYSEIDRLEKSDITLTAFSDFHELYPYAAVGGLGLLMLFPWVRAGLLRRWIGF